MEFRETSSLSWEKNFKLDNCDGREFRDSV